MKYFVILCFVFTVMNGVASIPGKDLICENNPTIEDQVTTHYRLCLKDKLDSIEIYMGYFKLDTCHSSGGIDNLKFMACLNDNFKLISKKMNLELDKCYNDLIRAPHMKYYLTTLFKSCVSRNLVTINSKIEAVNI